ncbi:hypothetical protein DY000_02020223 [Brassica cretica]|uniref:Uncharacterized protein n=1 Tax=Brassica cretica TaxID=69181 RepID=A0ABQ7E650_BRACR|nr:hypothetical protein DY000_02020223 [Brassica cretica]
MSGMNNPTLHRHAVHGLQGATPSLCLHDLVPFAGPSHEVNDHKISLVQAIIVYLGSYQLSPCLVLLILNQISSVQTRFIQDRISSVQLRTRPRVYSGFSPSDLLYSKELSYRMKGSRPRFFCSDLNVGSSWRGVKYEVSLLQVRVSLRTKLG